MKIRNQVQKLKILTWIIFVVHCSERSVRLLDNFVVLHNGGRDLSWVSQRRCNAWITSAESSSSAPKLRPSIFSKPLNFSLPQAILIEWASAFLWLYTISCFQVAISQIKSSLEIFWLFTFGFLGISEFRCQNLSTYMVYMGVFWVLWIQNPTDISASKNICIGIWELQTTLKSCCDENGYARGDEHEKASTAKIRVTITGLLFVVVIETIA